MNKRLEKVYGMHSVRAIILTRPSAVKRIIIADSSGDLKKHTNVTGKYLELVRSVPVKPELLPWQEFLRVAGLQKEEKHQGICVFVEPRSIYSEDELGLVDSGRLVVALDQVTNPQNLGSILRVSAFFNVDAVLLMRNRAADITPEVVRIASGGAEFVKIYQVINLARALEKLKGCGYWVYGLDERGSTPLADTEFDRKTVIVFGAEGEGLRHKTKKYCDFLVRIPGGREGIESLNVAVATAIAIADISRRDFFSS